MKREEQKEEVFTYKEEVSGHGRRTLKNIAKLRFAFLTVTVMIVIFCNVASCSW
jgi:hypothetical protein